MSNKKFTEVSLKKLNTISSYNERMILRNSSGKAVAEIRQVSRNYYYTILTLCDRGETLKLMRSYFKLEQKEDQLPVESQYVKIAA